MKKCRILGQGIIATVGLGLLGYCCCLVGQTALADYSNFNPILAYALLPLCIIGVATVILLLRWCFK